MLPAARILLLLCLVFLAGLKGVTVTGSAVVIRRGGKDAKTVDNSNVVVWLKPSIGAGTPKKDRRPAPARFKIVQEDKRFIPHLLAVPVGSVVDFPNLDPFFHNVFSMFDGKRFDLGLYEAGASHSVTFDRPGISYIFCNIHPEMGAVVVVMDSPYFGVSDTAGQFALGDVPEGRYILSVWHERAKPEAPNASRREITISSDSTSLGTIRLVDSGQLTPPHKNKYGRDYESPNPPGIVYK